ncbi:MAG: hypothetical protein EOO45_16660 [Flavobacterium sp.]|nr:MAG: hypothetical protein EOO45_16660 [Flavobacterium sp.]
MKYLLLVTVLLLSASTFAQDKDADTIFLKEVKVDKSHRKLKVKTVKYGEDNRFVNYTSFKSEDRVCYFMVENIPYGILKELTLNFSFVGENLDIEKVGKAFLVSNTEYEITLFKQNDDGSVGDIVNLEPMNISIGESKKWQRKIKMYISKLNFEADSFFIRFKILTDISCSECYYYFPVSSRLERRETYHNEAQQQEKGTVTNRRKVWGGKPFIEIKTLTREY